MATAQSFPTSALLAVTPLGGTQLLFVSDLGALLTVRQDRTHSDSELQG